MGLDPESLGAEFFQGLPSLVIVDAVAAGRVPGDGLGREQVVVDDDVGDARRVRRAEAGGTDGVGDEGRQNVLLLEKGGNTVLSLIAYLFLSKGKA